MWPTPALVSRTAPLTEPAATDASIAACRSAWLWACPEMVRMWGQPPRVPALSRGILALARQSWLAKPSCQGPLSVLPPTALCPLFLRVLKALQPLLQALLQKTFTSNLLLLSLLPLMNSLHSFSWPSSYPVPTLSPPALFSSISLLSPEQPSLGIGLRQGTPSELA